MEKEHQKFVKLMIWDQNMNLKLSLGDRFESGIQIEDKCPDPFMRQWKFCQTQGKSDWVRIMRVTWREFW